MEKFKEQLFYPGAFGEEEFWLPLQLLFKNFFL